MREDRLSLVNSLRAFEQAVSIRERALSAHDLCSCCVRLDAMAYISRKLVWFRMMRMS